jgi:GT2 family glycosyltransferase
VKVIVNGANLGFAAANAVGVRASRGRLILFLNNDTEVLDGTLATLVATIEAEPATGAVGCRIVGTDGTVQQTRGMDASILTEAAQRLLGHLVYRRFPPALRFLARWHDRTGDADWITGACMLTRRTALEATGGFDTGFFMYFEDMDLCRRMRDGGWRIRYVPEATIIHHGGKSASRVGRRIALEYRASQLRYYRKHHAAPQLLLLKGYLAMKILTAGAAIRLRRSAPGDRFRRAFLLLALRRVLRYR